MGPTVGAQGCLECPIFGGEKTNDYFVKNRSNVQTKISLGLNT